MTTALHCGITIRLYKEDKVFGPGVARLMELVEQTGSLRAAAGEMKMAYSKAWTILKNAERGLGFALLTTATGGMGGGGAQLTEEGKTFLLDYRAFETESREAVETLYRRHFGNEKNNS